ncbi:hypothetical protein [Geobacter pickeringii]|nr:hypothetical protein [Geobacter pickeringii]
MNRTVWRWLAALWMLGICSLPAVPVSAAGEGGDGATLPEPLTPGRRIERPLTVGESHVYALELGSAQAVTVEFDRRGVAAVVTISAPDGQKIGAFGSTTSGEGKETIFFVTEQGGTHRLTVKTFFQPSPAGRYLIRLADVHAASVQELGRVAAQYCEEKRWLDRGNNFLVDEALRSLSRCMVAVAHRLEGGQPKAATVAGEANAEIDYLIGRWRWGEFVSVAYQQSLVADFRMLASAAKEPDAARSFAIVEEVAEDLRIKAEHCRKSSRGLGEDVAVTVKTWRGNSEEPNLLVYYQLGIFEFTPSRAPESFPQKSSPTRHTLPAGRYLMWAGRPGQAEPPKGSVRRVRIGEGMRQVPLDLFVP